MPTSWAEVPARLRPAFIQVVRLTVAAVVAYVVADTLYPGILDLTAPLTALLVVQASTVGTLLMGVVRVGAVLTGVLVAVAVASFIGLSWWSLALAIGASLILAKVLRLGEQSLETPISAMLILAVATPGLAAEVRVANTLIGTAVGIAFSLLVPVAIPNRQASDAVRSVTRSQAALLNEVAVTLGDRPPHPDEVQAWSEWIQHIEAEIDDAAAVVQTVEQSRLLNPRALAVAAIHPGLRSALHRLERCLEAERSLITAVGREAPPGAEGSVDRSETELRRALAVVLDDVANGLRAFGDLVEAEYGRRAADRADEALVRCLEIVRETRAVLTELMLLRPSEKADLPVLQSSVLAAIDQILVQLDLERPERSEEPWLARRGISVLRPARGPAASGGRHEGRSRGR